jgi:dimeric dUTPase (all-alpha-NTP-PPase superfamily)
MRLYNTNSREKLFDVLYKSYVKNDLNASEIEKAKNTIFQHIKGLDELLNSKNVESEIQRYITSDDVKTKFTQILNDVRYIKNKVDNGSFLAFKETNFDEGRDFIEIDLIANGVNVSVVKEGEQVEVSKVFSESLIIKETQLGGAIQVPFSLLETGQFNRIFNRINDFAISYLNAKYRLLYKLLVAAAQGNATIPYAGGANTLEKDIKTINTAINTMKQDLKDNYDVNFNYPVIVYANPVLEPRFIAAQNQGKTVFTTTTSEILTSQPIQWIFTYELQNQGLPTDKALFVLPQVSQYFAERIGAQVDSQRMLTSFSEFMTVRSVIAAGIGDIRTCRIVEFS